MIAQLWSRRRDNLARGLAEKPLSSDRRKKRLAEVAEDKRNAGSRDRQGFSPMLLTARDVRQGHVQASSRSTSSTSLATLKALFTYSPPVVSSSVLPTRKARGITHDRPER